MTLLELLKLLKTRLKLVVLLPVVCAAVVLGWRVFLVQPTYTATATLVVNGQFQFVSAFADTAAQEASGSGVSVTATASSSTNTVTFEAEGAPADACVEAVNDAVNEAARKSRVSLADLIAETTEATSAASAGRGPAVYAAVAFLGGLFVVVVIVVIEDMVVRRVHDWTTVVEACGMPYLGTGSGSRAERERLSAEVSLAGAEGERMPASVCLVPAGSVEAETVAAELRETPAASAPEVLVAPPLASGADALYEARAADATVVVVQEEVSTFADLETLLRELGVAGVRPVGFVYVRPPKK